MASNGGNRPPEPDPNLEYWPKGEERWSWCEPWLLTVLGGVLFGFLLFGLIRLVFS